MKILLSNSPNLGGGNRSLLLLYNTLYSRDIESHIIVPAKGQMTEACAVEGVRYEIQGITQPSWRRPDQVWSHYRNWSRILQKAKCDLVHANDITTARSVSLAANRLGIPVVCHIRYAPGSEFSEWAFRRLPKPSAFIFNSYAMRDECGTYLKRVSPKSKQFVIHNAVNLDQFVSRSKTVDKKRVGILANLLPVKGHRDFLQMAKLLTERGNDVEYWLIGEDIHETGYRTELEVISTKLGLDERVQFLGHRSDVPDLLNELDVLVCASHVEPFGRCLIEGMACEKPVVATRVGGIPEVVDHGVTGILVAPHAPIELADALESLLEDTGKRDLMGKAGRRRAQQLFSPEAHVESVLQVYQAVTGTDDSLNNQACESIHV